MKKKDLSEASDVNTVSIAKLGKNGNINTIILVKICKALDCDISDIMEIVKERSVKTIIVYLIIKNILLYNILYTTLIERGKIYVHTNSDRCS